MNRFVLIFFRLNFDSILIGSVAFLFMLPLNIINPFNVQWILQFSGIADIGFTWLGWVFFKDTALFQFPLFQNSNYGFAEGSNIIFSGSIPLLGIIFKPFSAIIPSDFQYFGLWIYLSFIMQSYFSKKILGSFSTDKILVFLMTILFVVSPIFLHRVYIPHIGLLAQWILLFAIYLLLRKDFSYKIWFLNLLIALLVHGYLFMFSFILFNFDLLLKNKVKLNLDSLKIIYLYLGIFSFMALFGYFAHDSLGLIGGFGYYSMNLNSIINPSGLGVPYSDWSILIPALESRELSKFYADYEGFNYLGIGALVLLPFALVKVVALVEIIKRNKKKVFILSLMSFLLLLISVSNHIGFGSSSFVIDINSELYSKLSIFRASGRFFWINYYLIFCLLFVLITRSYPRKVSICIFLFAISLHLLDSVRSYEMIRDRFAKKVEYDKSSLDIGYNSILWTGISKKYKEINIVYPGELPKNEDLFRLCYFAAKNGIKINSGYFARVNRNKLEHEKERLSNIFETGLLDENVLYVIDNKVMWEDLKERFDGKLYFKEAGTLMLVSISDFI